MSCLGQDQRAPFSWWHVGVERLSEEKAEMLRHLPGVNFLLHELSNSWTRSGAFILCWKHPGECK
jgi:hypothetical protein